MKAAIVIGHLAHKGNEAALLRSAEAFGINHVHVIGEREYTYDISQGADQHVTFFEHDDADALCGYLRAENYTLVAIENTADAIEVGSGARYPTNPAFVVGEEGSGVPDEILSRAEQVRIIPQSPNGYVTCLNTTVAGSIALFDWYQDCRSRAGGHLETVSDVSKEKTRRVPLLAAPVEVADE